MTTAIDPTIRIMPAPSPGIYRGVPMHVYHAWDAVSNTRLSHLRRSPAHLQAYIAEPPADTVSQVVGRAAHTAILEPEQFADIFCVAEQCTATKKDGDQCTNAGTHFHPDFGWRCGIAAHCNLDGFDDSRICVSAEQRDMCTSVRESLLAHRSANLLLTEPGEVELSLVWMDFETGLLCKARPDRHVPDLGPGIIADLKSTKDASKRGFERAIDMYGYHLQAAHYLTGAQACGLRAGAFAFIPFEKEAPFAVGTYRIVQEALDAGAATLRPLMRLYKQCKESGQWPAYSQDLEDITLPDYGWKKADDEIAMIGTRTGTNYEVTP